MHGSTMSPANQFPGQQYFIESPVQSPGSSQPSPPAQYPPSYPPHPHKGGFQFRDPQGHPGPLPRRPEPIQAGSQLTPPWSNGSLHYPDSQISSPASSDSTVASSPTSPASPAHFHSRFPGRDGWQGPGYPPFNSSSNFPPPNTVAPHSDMSKAGDRRPDACYGGGAHRFSSNPRGCPETMTSSEDHESFASRLYAGSTNTIAPNSTPHHGSTPHHNSTPHHASTPHHGYQDHFGNHAGLLGGYAGSPYDPSAMRLCNARGEEMGALDIEQLGIKQEELILMPTRDLNKFLKSKGLTREKIKTVKAQRRTLKNRGYASQCRHKREGTIKEYSSQLEEIEDENKAAEDKNQDLRNTLVQIKYKISKLEAYWQGKREQRR